MFIFLTCVVIVEFSVLIAILQLGGVCLELVHGVFGVVVVGFLIIKIKRKKERKKEKEIRKKERKKEKRKKEKEISKQLKGEKTQHANFRDKPFCPSYKTP